MICFLVASIQEGLLALMEGREEVQAWEFESEIYWDEKSNHDINWVGRGLKYWIWASH